MFDQMKNVMHCPRCDQFIKRDRRKCPFCGLELMTRTADISEDRFFSSEQRYDNKNLSGFEPRKRAVLPNDPVFSSGSRSARNGGYTQQNTDVKDNTVYTGEIERNGNDSEYFSSARKRTVADEPKRKKRFVSNNEYYSSAERNRVLMQDAKLAEQKKTDDHSPDVNPYSGAGVLTEKPIETEHSHEYKANSLIEFTKHRFAREDANMILFWLVAAVFCDAAAILLDVLIDSTHISFPSLVVYTIELLILTVMSLRTYKRRLTLTIAVVTILFSIGMLVYMPFIDETARAAEIFMLYLPIGALNIVCYKLTRRMAYFQEKWEAYITPRDKLVDVKKTTEDIKIYGEANEGDSEEAADENKNKDE